MRRVSCDQYEFDPPDSEQSLDIAIATASRSINNLTEFLIQCGASSCAGAVATVNWERWSTVIEHIRKFAGLEILHPSQTTTIILRNDWNDVELGLSYGSRFLWYRWYTSA